MPASARLEPVPRINEALEPGKLVIELWAGLRIAVRQVDAADKNAFDGGLDVPALVVRIIAGKPIGGEHVLCMPQSGANRAVRKLAAVSVR